MEFNGTNVRFILFLLFPIFILTFLASPNTSEANPTLWYVNDVNTAGDVFTARAGDDGYAGNDPNWPFLTIAQALTVAAEGDTIYIDIGTYIETIIIQTNYLSLIGADSTGTIIDPPAGTPSAGYGLSYFANNPETGNPDTGTTGLAPMRLMATSLQLAAPSGADGIYAANCVGLIIRNLTITNKDIGIYFVNVGYSEVTSCSIGFNSAWGILLGAGSSYNRFLGNIVSNNAATGIVLEAASDYNLLEGNLVDNNISAGIKLDSSNNNILIGNQSWNNKSDGIVSVFGSSNLFLNNRSRDALNPDAEGFWIYQSPNNSLIGNISSNHGMYGFWIASGSNNTTMIQNLADNNLQYQFYLQGTITAFAKNSIITPPAKPTQGVSTSSAVDLYRNYWGTTNENEIAGKRAGPGALSWYRFSIIDPNAGADTVAPAAPAGIIADSLPGKVLISWDTVTANEESGAFPFQLSGYRIYRSTDTATPDWQPPIGEVPAGVTQFVDRDFAEEQTNYYRVTAFDTHLTNGMEYENESFYSPPVAIRAPKRGEDTVAIIVPVEDAVVAGTIDIIGTANRMDFLYYSVEIGTGPAPGAYTEIYRDIWPVYSDLLTAWNTTDMPEGYDFIRLRSVGVDGSELTVVRRVIVNNQPPELELTVAPTFALPGDVTITISVSEPLKQLPTVALALPGGDTVYLPAIQTGDTSFSAIYTVTIDDSSGEAVVTVSIIDLGDSTASATALFTIYTDFTQSPAATVSVSGFTDWKNSGQLVMCDGQPTPIGISTSNTYTNKAGFLYTLRYQYATSPAAVPDNLKVNNLPCQGMVINDQTPVITWDYFGVPGDYQAAYEVQIAGDPSFAVVDNASGIVLAAQPSYQATPLPEEKLYFVRVRVKNAYGVWSDWTSGEDSFVLDVIYPTRIRSAVTTSGFADWEDSGHLIFCDGQPTPIGISTSNIYTNKAGYLYTLLYQYAVYPPALPENLRANGLLCRGVFLADQTPELSWDYISAQGDHQTAYEVQIAGDPLFATRADSSGIVLTEQPNYNISPLSEGVYYYARVRVKNDYGLWSGWTAGTDSFILDLTPPTTTKTVGQPAEQFGADTWLVIPETPFTFSATDTLSGVARIQYRVDEAPWIDLVGNTITLAGYDSGLHTIDYRAIDLAGGGEAYHREWDILDTGPIWLLINPPDPGSINVLINDNAGTAVETIILGYEVSRPCTMTITATNLADSSVWPLVNAWLPTSGVHKFAWDGSDLANPPIYLQPGEYQISYTATAGGSSTANETTVALTGGDSKAVISNTGNSPAIINRDVDAGDSIYFTLHTWAPPLGTMDFTEIRLFKDGASLVYSETLIDLPATRAGVAQTYFCTSTVFPEVGVYTYTIDARYRPGPGGPWRSANTRQGTILVVDNDMIATSFGAVTVWHDINDNLTIEPSLLGYQTVSMGGKHESDRYEITADGPLTKAAYILFSYDTELYAGKLGLKKTDGVVWNDVITVADEQNNRLIGKVTSLSTVAIFARVLEDKEPPRIVAAGINPRGLSPTNLREGMRSFEISYQVQDDFSRYLPQFTLGIYDENDYLVRTLVDRERRGLMGRELWEGLGDNAALVPVGRYRAILSVTDHSGKTVRETIATVTVDDIPPAIAITPPVSPTNQNVNLAYTTDDNLTPPELMTVFGDESPYSVQGEYTVTLTAIDEANNTAAATVSFVIDNTPPTLIVNPASSPTNQSVTLAYTVTDNYSQPENITVTGDTGPFTAEGAYNITFTATDEANNSASAEAAFIIDRTPPVIAGLTVTPEAIVLGGEPGNDTVTISFTFSDNLLQYPGSLAVEIRDTSGAMVRELLNLAPAAWGGRTITWNGKNAAGEAVEVGAYRVVITGADAAGNRVAAEAAVTVQNDVTPPQIEIVVPAVNGSYSYTLPLSFQWTISDSESGVASSSATLDGAPVTSGQTIDLKALGIGGHTLTVTAADNAGKAATVSAVFTVIDDVAPTITLVQPATPTNQDVTLHYVVYDEITDSPTVAGDNSPYTAEGVYTVTLTATDEAGNQATSNAATFTVDKTAPMTTLTVGTPSYNDFITSATPLTLASTDNLTALTTHDHLDGGAWQNYAGAFTLPGEGAHTVGYRSTDAAGNVESEQSRTLIVDNTPPASVLTADLVSADGTVAVPETQITLTAADLGAGVERIEFRRNNDSWATYTAPFELKDTGLVTIGYRALDRLGNAEAARTVSYTVKPALELEAGLLTVPRVLCWWNASHEDEEGGEGDNGPSREEWTAALTAVLDSAALDYLIVETPTEFLAKLTDYNVYLIIGDEKNLEDEKKGEEEDNLGDSLVAAQVALGKTLISFGYEDLKTPDEEDRGWENIFGIKVDGVLNGTAHLASYPDLMAETTTLTIEGRTERIKEVLLGEVLGEVSLIENGEHGEDEHGHGGHGEGDEDHNDTWPAIVANDWESGKTLYLSPDYSRNLDVLSDVLKNAILWSAPTGTAAVPGGIVGIKINAKNAVLPLSLRVYVEASLPTGSAAFEVYDNGTNQGNAVVWTGDLAAGAEGTYRFLLRLPTDPGPYTVTVYGYYSKGLGYRLVDSFDLVVSPQ